MISTSRTVAVAVAFIGIVAACGSSDDDSTEATPATDPPTATEAPTDTTTAPTDPPATTAAPSPATDPPATDPPATDPPATDPPATDPPATDPPAAAGQMPANNSGWTLQPYAAADITAGPVVAYWYRGANGGNHVVVYTGAGIAGAAGLGLCPGNSIATTDFMHISNAPSEPGACDGFPTDVGNLQVCDHGIWIYETLIPGDLEGFLFASLEWNSDAGPTGLTSQTETAPDMPELEPGLASYSVPPWFTDDGSSMIECADPIT